MMAAILEFCHFEQKILPSLDSQLILSISSQTHSHLAKIGFPAILHKKKTSIIHSDSTWWWQPSWILPSVDSATVILNSNTLLSSFRFTQKHSHCTLTLTQTNLIWLKLIHSYLTWWCQPSWNTVILNSALLDSAILHKTLTQTNSIWLKLIHSDPTLWWQSSWILPSWIQQFCTKLCLKLIHSDSTWWCQTSWILPSWIQPFWTKKKFHSFILTQLDDVRHLEFCYHEFGHFGFSHLSIFSQTHSHLPRLVSTICT